MEQIFLTVLNMSITASYVISFVIIVRMLLKKAPKLFSYSLWSVVLFRLICPFSFSSALSFFELFKAHSMEHIPANIGYMEQPQVDMSVGAVDSLVNNSLPAATPAASVNPMQVIISGLSLLWIIGIIGLLIYSIISYIRLQKKVNTAVLTSDNIFKCEEIESPFVLGIINPRIYLPVGLTEKEESYILMHEKIHIKRFDYLIKPFAFLVLCFHWFNPLVWISFALMSHDMEMSCDESVLKEMGRDIKKDYSTSLLALSFGRNMISGSPLAFGESNVKNRIKNVLNYKKPGFWVVVTAVMLVSVVGIGLTANPQEDEQDITSLKIENIASMAKYSDQLMIRVDGSGTSFISGVELAQLIGTTSSNWSEKSAPSNFKLNPDLTVYIDIGSRHTLNFYKSEPELAVVQLDKQRKYYKIPKDTYEKLFLMWAVRSYIIPDEVMKAIADGKMTKLQSVQDTPNNVDYKVLKVGKENYFIYKKESKYYVESPYQFISEITEEVYKDAVKFANPPTPGKIETSSGIENLVEDNLRIIMSSPLQSSNPNDYIKANSKAYDNILKYGGENALSYMLSEFKNKKVGSGLKGHIMMRLCKELLGPRNNVDDEALSPNEWFDKLSIRKKIELPDFIYDGNDPIERLVYLTEIEKNRSQRGEFMIIAPHIFGSYEEGNKLKVFATTICNGYILYDKTLSHESGSVVPAAITYVKNADGNYTVEKYEQARDGSEFAKSIREFCVMPVSGKKINNLADKILEHYGDYDDILSLERKNLIEHLKKNKQFDVFLHKKHYQKPDELIPIT